MSTAPVPSALHPAVPAAAARAVEADQGWRYVRRVLPDGSVTWDTVPLTEADILDPQEGDVMPQRPEHERATRDLIDMLEAHYRHDPTYTIFHDLQMDWGIPGLERPSPDLAVVPGVRDPKAIAGIFDVQKEGTRPVLVMEVVSPGYMDTDVNPQKKVRIYAAAGVQEYVILDPGGYTGTPVVGYRLGRGRRRYQAVPLDADGMVTCTSIGIRVGLDGERVVLIDTASGKRLLTHMEQIDLAAAAQAQAEAAQAQVEAAQAQVEAAQARAEAAQAQAEVEARARLAAEAELARLRLELQAQRRG